MSIKEYLEDNYQTIQWDGDMKTIVLDGVVISGDAMNALAGNVKMNCGYDNLAEKEVVKAIKNYVKTRNKSEKVPATVSLPDWMKGMDTKDGVAKDSANNNRILFEQYPGFIGKFVYDEIEQREMYDGRPLNNDVVLAEIKCHVEELLSGNRNPNNIKSAALVVCKFHRVNPLKDKLRSLRGCWDGVKRLEELFIKAFECDNTQYIREVTRQLFYAWYYRIVDPGCIFNMIFMFEGAQGIGKSELLKRMMKLIGGKAVDGMKFNDDRSTLEKLSRHQICIFDELGNMSRAELEFIKDFISRSSDTYDEKYRSTETYPRSCILVGNLNPDRKHFLKDVTIDFERRFIIIPCHAKGTADIPEKSEAWWWNKFLPDEYLMQVWAELVWMVENEPNFQWMGWTQARITAARQIQKDYSSLENDDVLIDTLNDILNYKYPQDKYYDYEHFKYDVNNNKEQARYQTQVSGVLLDRIKCGALRSYMQIDMRMDRSLEYFTAMMKRLGWGKKKVCVYDKDKNKRTTIDMYVRLSNGSNGGLDECLPYEDD